jgi:hypothetical protein
VESERDVLKTNLREEEVARIAAEGRIALPPMVDDDEEDLLLHSPRKSPRKPRLASEDSESGENKENRVPKKTLELQNLHEELNMERRLRERAQEQIDFMKMECQFQCCSCRIAEKGGHGYVHDASFVSEMDKIRGAVPTPPSSEGEDVEMTVDHEEERAPGTDAPIEEDATDLAETTFHTVLEPGRNYSPTPNLERYAEEVQVEDFAMHEGFAPRVEANEQVEKGHEEEVHDPFSEPTHPASQDVPVPQTPVREIRTITTTTTIPMLFSPFPASNVLTTPMTLPASRPIPFESPAAAIKADGTLDREAALAQIRERRGRARSVAMGQATPRKQMMDGVAGRRDISAPNRL